MQRASRLGLLSGIVVLCLGPLVAVPASAQPGPNAIPEQVVQKLIELGLRNIHRAICDGFNQCTPATEDEIKNPPISVDQARVAIFVGTRSAFAGWCGFNADKRSVLPLLRQLRQGKQFNERQLALMAVIHGIQQNITAEQLKAKGGACDEEMRKRLDTQLPKA